MIMQYFNNYVLFFLIFVSFITLSYFASLFYVNNILKLIP